MNGGFVFAPEVCEGVEIECTDGTWRRIKIVRDLYGGWLFRTDLEDGNWLAFWGDDWVMVHG